LLPAALQGIDIAPFAGAQEMDAATRTDQNNPAAWLILSWYSAGNGRGEKTWLLPHEPVWLLLSRHYK